jgi:hypothetical protein
MDPHDKIYYFIIYYINNIIHYLRFINSCGTDKKIY